MITVDCGEVMTYGSREVILDDVRSMIHELNSSVLKEMQEIIKEEMEVRLSRLR